MFLVREPLVRRSNLRITRLLNTGHYRRAKSALRDAAARYGDAWAGFTLGSLYAAGLGVPRSASNAFRWYLWSAERGDRFAQREVANAYLNGEGTRRDTRQATYWFRIGIAPQELARSYYDLAQTYARGHLAPVNSSKSNYYLDQACPNVIRTESAGWLIECFPKPRWIEKAAYPAGSSRTG
ncbi:MAG: tetratricopeptide repeat protein [Steroidobacteraceae bacterium]